MRLLFFLTLLFSALNVEASFKTAVFDMELAIQSTNDGKVAKQKLMKEFKFLESKLKKQEFSLMEKMKSFEKRSLILSDKKREEQKRELQAMSVDFQKKLQSFQVALQKKQVEATKPIVQKLEKQIAKIAEKNGYDVVLNRSANNVLWAKKAIDITKAVVAMYEKAI